MGRLGLSSAASDSIAATAQSLLERLFPICRSITGDGVRMTLAILREIAPWHIEEYPTGTRVYDWTIPREWIIRAGWIADAGGCRLVDFRNNNLHVVGYSVPVNARMKFSALRPHLHTLPELPDAIPYRTSYYREDWGFCLSQRQLDAFDPDGEYEVVIDAELKDGTLTLADCLLPGRSGQEFLVSTYCCHPSMANDNLSGVIVATLLLRELASRPERRHSWRFVMAPETIGVIAYLARHQADLKRSAGGFVIATCAGPGRYGVKKSFLGDHLVDRAVGIVMRDRRIDPAHYPFAPDGSDERQYSSPGFRIPVTTVCKDKYYEYLYYHTSRDDLGFVTGEAMAASLAIYRDVVDVIEANRLLRSRNPHCEPQLGRRGLYPQTGGAIGQPAASEASAVEAEVSAIAWILFLADGRHDLIAVAERSGLAFRDVAAAADKLEMHGLIEAATPLVPRESSLMRAAVQP
jgi:aminopeptidase-like protein